MAGGERPELRLGLVLYGGVSLAVYIYGVVVEVQRLLRASAAHEGLAGADPAQESAAYQQALADGGLSRAGVDIVSGTSAGGINGVLLAKALSVKADVRAVRDVWIEGGEIDRLMHGVGGDSPRSLIDTDVFAGMLEEGFAALDDAAGTTPCPPPPAFDLFVSSTHLLGERHGFLDALGGRLETLAHRKVFRRRRRAGYGLDEFAANGSLVKLSRATSAFPVAFQPVSIGPADELLDPYDEAEGWFADGGILNNKPFTEALGAIFTRSSDRPVRRWLLSVDPDPTAPTVERPGPEPGFDQVLAKAVAGIPRYQSVAADLESLDSHNERVRRVRRTVLDRERDLAGDGLEPAGAVGSAYERLRRLAWAEEIGGQLLTAFRPGRLREELPSAAARSAFVEAALRRVGDGAVVADLAFQKRRAYYLIKLVGLADAVDGDAGALRQALWAGFESASQVLWEALAQQPFGPGVPGEDGEADPTDVAEARILAALPGFESAGGRIAGEIAAALKGASVSLPADGGSGVGAAIEVALTDVFDGFEPRDELLLPIELDGGLGSRDAVDHAQISTETARGTEVPPSAKLAGDAIMHFGGFLDESWRANDLMWGRLDGAETIVKAMLAGRPKAQRDAAIAAVQEEIFRDEHRDAVPAGGDWRKYLRDNAIGDAGLGSVGMGRRLGLGVRAGTVLRRMLHTARLGSKAEPPKNLRRRALRHTDRFVRGTRFILLPLRLLAYPFVRWQVARTEKKQR